MSGPGRRGRAIILVGPPTGVPLRQ